MSWLDGPDDGRTDRIGCTGWAGAAGAGPRPNGSQFLDPPLEVHNEFDFLEVQARGDVGDKAAPQRRADAAEGGVMKQQKAAKKAGPRGDIRQRVARCWGRGRGTGHPPPPLTPTPTSLHQACHNTRKLSVGAAGG
eukprot:gene13248-biopygen23031